MMTPSKQKVEGQGCKVYSKERYGYDTLHWSYGLQAVLNT